MNQETQLADVPAAEAPATAQEVEVGVQVQPARQEAQELQARVIGQASGGALLIEQGEGANATLMIAHNVTLDQGPVPVAADVVRTQAGEPAIRTCVLHAAAPAAGASPQQDVAPIVTGDVSDLAPSENETTPTEPTAATAADREGHVVATLADGTQVMETCHVHVFQQPAMVAQPSAPPTVQAPAGQQPLNVEPPVDQPQQPETMVVERAP